MLKDRETYNPTKGVENEGYEFEIAMLSFYCFHLCCNEYVKDFKIAIYDNHYQPFDDIVIDISTEIVEKYAIQLKHVKDKLPLNSSHFGKSGKMVLSKHFKFNFSKTNHAILLTNGVVNDELTVENYNIMRKTSLTAIERCLDTSGDAENHLYQIYDGRSSKQITFYTSQMSRNEVDEAIREAFRIKFYPNGGNLDKTVQKFKTFFYQWKKGMFGFYKIDKEDIKMKIAEILFYDYILDYRPEFGVEISNKADLLQKVLNDFVVTLIQDTEEEILNNMCSFNLNETEFADESKRHLIIVEKNGYKDRALVLWRLRKFPLVVRINSDNKNVIRELINSLQNEHLSFVLVGKFSTKTFANLKTLVTLSDLEDSSYYAKILEEFCFSIQGQQDISLKKLLQCNRKFSEIITVKEILLIVKGNFIVGETEELPYPYISRQLSTTILKMNSLEQFPKELFVISGPSKHLQQQLPKCRFFNVEEFVEIMASGKILPPKCIILCEENAKSFATCLKYKNSNVHCLKVVDNDHLQLIYSKEKSENLRQFQLISEDQLHEILKNNINLICAGPGMGKSTLLKYLRRTCPPCYWTVKINLEENQHLQNDIQNDFTFESEVKNCFKEVHRVIYFFCGIDNLQKDQLMKATQYIQQLAKDDFRVFVFSADYLKEMLEKIFGVSSVDIEAFSDLEQQKYVGQRLKEHHTHQELNKMLQSFKMLKNNDILGTPMHLYMLTEIFISNPKARMEEIFVLTDVYKYFINTKYQYHLNKMSSAGNNQIINDGLYYRTEQYKLAAVSCFDPVYFRNVQCDRYFLDQLRCIGDVVGIIFKISNDGSIIFNQQTYADYFAALWLVNNYQKVSNIQDFFFQIQYKNILFMFNLEICKNYPAHLAVLYQNFDQLQKCHVLDETDPLGRSTLHVACSYGTKFPKLQTTEAKHEKTGKLEQTFRFAKKEVFKENVESKKIVDYLINNIRFDPLQTDMLFAWNLLDYAFKVLNLYAVEAILVKFPELAKLTINKLKDLTDDLFVTIYFCVKLGYKMVLKLAAQTSAFSTAVSMEDCNGENLLYIAVKSGNYEIVATLLDEGASTDSITTTYHKRSSLHVAVDYNYVEIVQLLLEKGAHPDIMDRYRNIPLHLASSKGLYYCAQLLLKYGSDVNFADNFGRTSLHLAAIHGHTNITELLINADAKIDKLDKFGNSPISCATDKKQVQIVYLLFKKGAKTPAATLRRQSCNEFDEYTSFQLHWAAFTGQAERIQPLLQDGWNINQVDNFGRTPLYRAVTEKNIKIVQMLVNRNADVNIPDINNVSPLCQAIRNDDLKLISFLLQVMSCIDVRDSFNYTPLHWAALSGNPKIVSLLLSKNPDVDVVDSFGRTPIHCAVENGHHEIVTLLDRENTTLQATVIKRSSFLGHYGSFDYKTLDLTPLEEAVGLGSTSLVRNFLKQDIDINTVDSSGHTLLERAVVKECISMVRLLLENGARVDTRDKCGSTVLHWAAYGGNLDITKVLIEYNADVNASDIFGYNCLQIAAMERHKTVLELLLKAGCDAKSIDFCGNSALSWACKKGCAECVRVLLQTDASDKTQEDFLEITKRQHYFLTIALFHKSSFLNESDHNL